MKKVFFQIAIVGALIVCPSSSLAQDTVDPTFGTNGKVMEVLSDQGGARFDTLLVHDDDKVIAIGSARLAEPVTNNDNYRVITMYRYLKDGSRDISFGDDGVTVADHICEDWDACEEAIFGLGDEDVVGAHFQSDGKIVLALTAWRNYTTFGVARFDSDGILDTAFGGHPGFGYGGDGVYAENSAIQSDDKILVVGRRVSNPDPHKVAVTRFTTDGLLDMTFGTANGTVLTNTHPGTGSYSGDSGNDVAVQSDGKIIVAGTTAIQGCGDNNESFFTRGLLERLNSDGTFDTSFGSDGVVKYTAASVFDAKPWDLSTTYPCSESTLKSVAVQSDGKIVVMGTGVNAPFSVFLARFNTNGGIDTSFGYEGVIALYDDYSYKTYDHLNTVFTNNGQDLNVENMKLLKDGYIALSGNYYTGSDYDNKHFMTLLFTKDGQFIRTFGNEGIITTNVDFPDDFLYGGATAFDLAEQTNGKILLGGYADGYDNPSHGVLVRLPLLNVASPSIIMYLLN
ncbi:MAG: hypothetical protein DRG30_08360 [Epsilonproteobacteria bacterium]|nr:MAG: hypothetical protein DRG30_08360 [Campylobacterota bacterium]